MTAGLLDINFYADIDGMHDDVTTTTPTRIDTGEADPRVVERLETTAKGATRACVAR